MELLSSKFNGDGRYRVMMLGNFQCGSFLIICIIAGQGPSVLAVGVGGGGLDFFSPLIIPPKQLINQIQVELQWLDHLWAHEN